jgi:hypothetical protein
MTAPTGQCRNHGTGYELVETIEHLDFDPKCEADGCDRVATLLAILRKPCCGPVSRICCQPCVDRQMARMDGRLMQCGRCGAHPISFSPDKLTVQPLGGGAR